MRKRNPLNAPGNWYIDTACIDCGAACDVAPGMIIERDGKSVFARQPATAEELLMAWRARILCPVASVRTVDHAQPPKDVFPERMTEGVYRLGYNARSSYGAHSYAVRRDSGNLMIDSPRWAEHVVARLDAWGGLSDILLSHRDDVADAHRYAERYRARVWIHEADRSAAPYATHLVEGREPLALAPDVLAIPVPGHTKGSVAYLFDQRCLFTGDTLAWDFGRGDLTAFRDMAWFSWAEQIRSLERLLDYPFEWVFAGHGGSHYLPAPEMHTRLAALIARMPRQ